MKNKRSDHYMQKSLNELFMCYDHESNRLNKEESDSAKRLIRIEVLIRIMTSFKLLELYPGNYEQIYKQFLNNKWKDEKNNDK